MANYFEEMGWQPLGDGETPNHLLHLARLLRDYNMFEDLGVPNKLAPPASKQVVKDLPEITSNAGEQCPVCIKAYEEEERVRRLPCGHTFHGTCILPWLEKTNSCPLCRFELPTDDEEYEEFRKEKFRAKERQKDLELLHNSMFS